MPGGAISVGAPEVRGSTSHLRQALFCLSAAALALGGILFSGDAWQPPAAKDTATRPVASATARPVPRPGQRAELRVDARAFLHHFFRYEVGKLARSPVGLRATATSTFASELLRRPPRILGRALRPARLERLSLEFLSTAPGRAQVNGFALRGRARERFSFLFEVSGGGWRASGPGP